MLDADCATKSFNSCQNHVLSDSVYQVPFPVNLDADMHPQATVYINALLSKIILVHAGASIFDGA